VLPVDAAAWPRSPQPSVVVLGRLVPHKRVELAIDAVAALPGRRSPSSGTATGSRSCARTPSGSGSATR
jgi:glycosyltransferase involved in cell wall biosynthesis